MENHSPNSSTSHLLADIIQTEEKIVRTLEKTEKKLIHSRMFQSIALIVVALLVSAGTLYFIDVQNHVSIDKSLIAASEIDLSPSTAGILQQVYVKNGDQIPANTVVAKVGDELVKTKVSGIIISTEDNIGKTFNPGQTVVAMIDPTTLRVVGTIDENKGLSEIAVGQPVTFTVDAFGSRKYQGVVDEVSSTAHQTGVVFNISDERATQQFDIKVRFNIQDYSELKNGMSAKMTIFIR